MATTVTTTIKSSDGDYTTRAAWEAAQQGNLVSDDEIHEGACYAFEDTGGSLVINGSTTDATRYMRLYCAVGEGHAGYVDDTKARFTVSSGSAITNQDPYTRIEGQQIKLTQAGSQTGIGWATGGTNTRIERNIVRKSGGSGATNNGIGGNLTGTQYISNNVVFNITGTSGTGISQAKTTSGAVVYMYNNTVSGCVNGLNNSYADSVIAKNNIIHSCTNNAVGTYAAGTDYNACDDASIGYTVTGGGNTHDDVSQTFTFTDSANGDFRTTSGDTGARDLGVDLSGDADFPISVDVTNTTRAGTWDIGAYEYVSAGGASTPKGPLGNPFFGPLGGPI